MMLLPLICGECIKEGIEAGSLDTDEFMVPVAELRDEPVYDVTCSKGHHTECLVLHEQFELLFDLGFNGLIDGYYREAVSSFSSALERFQEFFTRVVLAQEVDPQLFDDTWKSVKNQSERQLGAFLFLYLRAIKEPPPLLPQKDIAFRNNVVHKGYVPTREEALAFGETVRSLVNSALKGMKRVYGETLTTIYTAPFERLKVKYGVEYGCTVTPILDVRKGGVFGAEDVRHGPMVDMIPATLNRREPHRIRFFKTKEELEAARAKTERA
jgi:hypothetical protein